MQNPPHDSDVGGGRASVPYTHPLDGHSPFALDIVQDFEVAIVCLLEH